MEGADTNCTRAVRHLWDFVAQRGDLSEQSARAFEQLVGVPLTAAGHGGDEGGSLKIDPLGALLLSAYLAEQGAVAAAMNAGWMLERGQGLPTRGPRGAWRVLGTRDEAPTARSLRLAAYYYELAARSNATAAQVDFAHLLLRLDAAGADVTVATAEGALRGQARVAHALELYRAAADAGDVEGATALAWTAVAGVGAAQNLTSALRLFREAAGHAQGVADGFAPVVGLVVTHGVNGLRWGLPQQAGVRVERWVARRARVGLAVPGPTQLLPDPLRKWARGVPSLFGGG